MKTFRFSLEPILTIREREEERALELYSTKIRAKTQAELRINHTEQQLQTLRKEYENSMDKSMLAGEMRQFANYICKVNERKMGELAALKFAENEVTSSLHGVMKARQRKEAIQKLKSREQDRYREALLKIEQKFIDELVTSRAAKAAAA